MTATYKIGDFVLVAYGSYGRQLARIEGVTKTGRIKVRAYNAGRETWYPSLRTIKAEEIIRLWDEPVPELVFRDAAFDADGYPLFDEAGYRVYNSTPIPPIK